MILTVVNSGSQLGWIRYHQPLRVSNKSEGWIRIDRKLWVFQIQLNPLDHKQDENKLKAKGHSMKQDENELEVK